MTTEFIRGKDRFLVLITLCCMWVGAPHAAAQKGTTDQNNDVVKVFKIKHAREAISDLDAKLSILKQNTAAVEQSLSVADTQSRPQLEVKVKAARNTKEQLSVMIARIKQDVDDAEKSKNRIESEKLLDEATILIGNAHLTAGSLQLHSTILEEAQRRVENDEPVFPDERGGGVFLDRAADLPIAAKTVTAARYDPDLGRFVLDQAGKHLLLPRMDPNLTAVVINCLFSPPPRNKIAESFNIDPVGMERIESNTDGTDEVLLGCQRLWNSEAGRILIDADDLLLRISMGRNRRGDDLTRQYKYHSLSQIILDHPAMSDMIHGVPSTKRDIEIRVWIRPEAISARRIRDEVLFGDVSFHFYTQTVRLANTRVFGGEDYPNPGADVFAAYFNQNFGRFAHLVLREDEDTGREIRPFEELGELAKIAGTVIWIKKSGIPMDRSWAADYPVPKALTRHNLAIIPLGDIEKDIVPPAVIFNQYGQSRIINEDGRIFMFKYDAMGQFVKMNEVVKDAEGHMVELPDPVVSGRSQ